jgi:AcrR family transcriptional regulator
MLRTLYINCKFFYRSSKIKSQAIAKRPRRDATANQAIMRQNICDAALAIFRRHGFAAVSMRAVAQELGVSTMSTYNYFASKDELFLEVRSRLFRQLSDYLSARAVSLDAHERLEQICRAYISYGLTHGPEYQLLFDAWQFEDYREVITKFGPERLRDPAPWDVMIRCVASFLTSTGNDASPARTSHLIWAQMHGLLALHHAHKLVFGVTVQQLIQDCIVAIFRIVGDDRAAVGIDR